MGCVYRAHNLKTGKSYIGITSRKFKARRLAHRENAKNPNARSGARSAFYEAIRSDGWMTFQWSVLATSNDMQELLELEEKFIEEYNALIPNGYNLDNSRARPVRDMNTGIVYSSVREAARETNTGHMGIATSARTGTALANGKRFEYLDSEKDEE